MKKFNVVAVLVLTLSANLLLADNDPDYLVYNTNNKSTSSAAVADLAPVTPGEADFNDVDFSCTIPFPASFFQIVAPVLPRYAQFDDDILPVHVGKLIPSIPMEADF